MKTLIKTLIAGVGVGILCSPLSALAVTLTQGVDYEIRYLDSSSFSGVAFDQGGGNYVFDTLGALETARGTACHLTNAGALPGTVCSIAAILHKFVIQP